MFRSVSKKAGSDVSPPPESVAEIIFCVFDEKQHVVHHFESAQSCEGARGLFRLLNDPAQAFQSGILTEAVSSRQPVSIAFSYGAGCMKYLYVLPYEYQRGKWRYGCFQVTTAPPKPDAAKPAGLNTFPEDRVCLLLADAHGAIISASSKVPEAFGYRFDVLCSMQLSDLFTDVGPGVLDACCADTNESILSCIFQCQDGTRRDVEVKKYSAADSNTLYAVCDITRPQYNEEITQAATRERRRIGQDLHDSIGQLLTGISLLSRSLANHLTRAGNSGDADAVQISELADDASNQIRQISRGLMPADIIHRGLFASLRDLAYVTTESCGISCEVFLDESVEFSDGAVETHLFRIAQEAVNNAVRHSGGSRIELSVSEEKGMPQLEVRDNGRWRNIMENAGGIGMKTMQYRATAVNGKLNIRRADGGGTRVTCCLEADELFETEVLNDG